jgi:hypothetical protein
MDAFNAEQFVARLNQGDFDDRLQETIRTLTHEQLRKVALLLVGNQCTNQGSPPDHDASA